MKKILSISILALILAHIGTAQAATYSRSLISTSTSPNSPIIPSYQWGSAPIWANYFVASSTSATSTFNGPIMIDDDETLSIGNPTGGSLNFTYGVVGSLYTSDGSNWGVNVYACRDSDRGNRVCSATPLNITGTDLNNSSPMALTYSWNAVTNAEWYRVYLYNSTSQYPDFCDPVNYDCYLDTVSNSVYLGEGAEEDQTVDPTLSGVQYSSPASFTGLVLDVRGRSYFSNNVGIGSTSPESMFTVSSPDSYRVATFASEFSGAAMDIFLSDEDLSNGYQARPGSIGTGSGVLQVKYNSGATDWGKVVYSNSADDVTLPGDLTVSSGEIDTSTIHANSSAGLTIHNSSHSPIALMGAGGGTGVTFYDGVINYGTLTAYGAATFPSLSATSTTATSTFSGNVNVVGNGIKFEYLSAPSAPTVALAGAGAGNVNNGSHIYSMTCVTEEGETENSSTNSVTVTNNATDGKVTVTLPTCSSNTTVARKVWRGVANNAFSVYLLTTINDNTTTSYTDNTADASLGNRTPEPTSGPQGGKTGVNTTAGTLRLGDSNTIKINQYGGMKFSSPYASLVFPQNAIKPIVLYNTSNQEQSAAGTGVEYGSMYYSGNILHLGHFIGTVGGSAREVQLHSNGQGSNFYMSLYRGQTAPKGWFDFAESGGTSIGGLTFARFNPDTWTASFGTNTLLNLSGTINMSGTAGYRMLDINPTETATGSGERKLIRAAVGSTELFTVGSNGNVGLGSSTPYTKLAVSGQVVVDNINATSTTATSTFSGHLVQGQNIVSSYLYPSFTYSTSTAWTGTTTIPLGVAFNGETWRAIKCFTDTGTVNVSVNDGTNRMNMFTASTTVGNVSLSTNNIFTESEKRYVDLGTPVSSPTKLSCTVQKTLNVE